MPDCRRDLSFIRLVTDSSQNVFIGTCGEFIVTNLLQLLANLVFIATMTDWLDDDVPYDVSGLAPGLPAVALGKNHIDHKQHKQQQGHGQRGPRDIKGRVLDSRIAHGTIK